MWQKRSFYVMHQRGLGIMKGVIIATSLVVVFAVFFEVFLRYVFGYSLWGAEEVSISVLLWLWFCAFAYAAYRRFHIGSNFPIRKRLARDIFGIVNPSFCLVVTLIACYFAYQHCAWVIAHHITNPVFRFPVIYVEVIAPVGLTLVVGYFIRDIVTKVRAFRHSGKEAQH